MRVNFSFGTGRRGFRRAAGTFAGGDGITKLSGICVARDFGTCLSEASLPKSPALLANIGELSNTLLRNRP